MNRTAQPGAALVQAPATPIAVDILLLLALAIVMFAGWLLLARPVAITVDGMPDEVRTRRGTVGALLDDLDLHLHAADRVTPARETPIRRNLEVNVERARVVRLLADGEDVTSATWASTPREAFAEAGFSVDAYDRAQVNAAEVSLETPLPQQVRQLAPVTYDRGYAWKRLESDTLQIRLRRAVPITVDEGKGLPYTVRTTAPTIGEALRQAEITLYLGDRVEPSLGSSVTAGLRVVIGRSTPIALQADGARHKTRVQARTVADALTDLGVVAAGLDRVEPPLDTLLYPNIEIKVTRVRENIEIEEQIEPYETIFQGNLSLPIDVQEVTDAGAEGITRQRYRVRYENGEMVSRQLEDDWLAQAPRTRIVSYGQKIEPQTAVVDGQTITYWRRIRMLATSYSAASAGGNRTRTGDLLRPGIVAVDPSLIPLGSKVLVPGYGYGDALDTGGGIRARRIDLAYDDASFVSVLRWTDVYLLWPPPAASEITWVVPNYPRQPGS